MDVIQFQFPDVIIDFGAPFERFIRQIRDLFLSAESDFEDALSGSYAVKEEVFEQPNKKITFHHITGNVIFCFNYIRFYYLFSYLSCVLNG